MGATWQGPRGRRRSPSRVRAGSSARRSSRRSRPPATASCVSSAARGGAPAAGEPIARWDPESGALEASALAGVDALVHLAGESVASGRWTESKKRRIRSSRVDATRRLAGALARLERPPRVLVTASAVGYYGDRGSELLREESAPGAGFLAEVCREWEAATEPAAHAGIRVVRLRIGMALSRRG